MHKNYALFYSLPENDFSISILDGAQGQAVSLDANLFVFPNSLIDGVFADHEANKFRYQYNILSSFANASELDGAVVEYGSIVSDINENKKVPFRNKFKNLPTVMLAENTVDFPCIYFDNTAGLREAIYHLVNEQGKKHIAFVSGPKENHDAAERLKVYKDTMTELGLRCSDDWIRNGSFSEYCEDEVESLIDNHPYIEAIVFANDSMATAGYRVCARRGLRVGDDILLTGFDNTPAALIHQPPLTTVKADPGQLSAKAIRELDGVDRIEEKFIIPTMLVKRRSSGYIEAPIYTSAGELLGTESEIEYKKIAASRIENAELSQICLAEMSYGMRELGIANAQDNSWIPLLLRSFSKVGSKRTFLYLFDSPVRHTNDDEWIMPENINLRAYSDTSGDVSFEYGEKVYKTMDIFCSDPIMTKERFTMIVVPLFYRENQFGFVCVDGDPSIFQFVYRMANMVSQMLQLIIVQRNYDETNNNLILANQAKSQFLTNMSHEIRTPINAVMGMTEMILRESKDPQIQEYAGDIRNASDSLLTIVNDILDISKIEAGKMSLVKVDYHIDQAMKSLMEQMKFRIREKDIKLNLNINDSIPAILHGDDIRIRQIVSNLLTNAIKYTEKGTVTLRVDGSKDGSDFLLRVSVTDTGMGIKEEDLQKLFVKFERIEERRNRNIEGTGLGLNITQGLLSLMGSKLEVKSIYGEGSEFFFTIRQPIVDMTSIKEYSEKTAGGENKAKADVYKQNFIAPEARVLVVDDSSVNRKVIKQLLKNAHIEIDEAENGLQCLEKYKENIYDIILLDHMMPELDGMQTLEKLKDMPDYEQGKPVIIVLTANAIAGAAEAYLTVGFDDYLSKPLKPKVLDELLIKYLPAEKVQFI